MDDETENEQDAHIILKFTVAGIPSEALVNASDVAKRLCDQSGPVDGSTLDPHHLFDHQHLFLKLSRKTSA